MNSLLPPNASELERRLEQVMARIDAIPVPLRDLWNPDTCPAELLPWLAWQLSIDAWKPYWSEYVKRARVRAAIDIQRHKGTVESVRNVVESFGGSVELREWFQADPPGEPGTFELWLTATGAGGTEATAAFVDDIIAEVSRTKPVSRHFTFTQGVTAAAGVGVAAVARPATYARLALYADVADPYEELDLLSPALDPRITYTGGPISYIGSDGLLKMSAANEWPLSYDPLTLQPVGRYVWEQRTNLLLWSNDMTATAWTKNNVVPTPSAADGKLGAGSMTRITRTSTVANAHVVQPTPLAIGTTVTRKVLAKAGTTGGRLGLRIQGTYPDRADAVFDLVAASVVGTTATSYTGVVANIKPLGGGVYECSITATAANSAVFATYFGPTDSSKSTTNWESASAVLSDVLVEAHQLEVAASPSPYIPTTTSQVTRAAQVATVNDLSSLRFNASESTLFAHGATPAFSGVAVDNVMACITRPGGESIDRVQARFIGMAPGVVLQASGTVYANWGAGVNGAGVLAKLAIGYSASSVSAYANGVLLGAAAGASPTVTALQIGRRGAGGFLNSSIRRIRYYPRAITNTELQALTA